MHHLLRPAQGRAVKLNIARLTLAQLNVIGNPVAGRLRKMTENSRYIPPTFTRDTIRDRPFGEEQGLSQSQTCDDPTTTTTHVIDVTDSESKMDGVFLRGLHAPVTENVCVSDHGRSLASQESTRQRGWSRRLRTGMKRLGVCANLRDTVAGLQILTLVSLVILLLRLTASISAISVGSASVKLLSKSNEDHLDEALVSITNMTGLVANVTKGLQNIVDDINHYTRKQTLQDDFDVVLRKLGRLIDEGLDQFD